MRYWFLLGGLAFLPAANASVQVKGVSLCQEAAGWRLVVHATGKTPYRVHTLSEPDRVLIDIPDATLVLNSQVKPADASNAPTLRFSQFTRDPDSVRIVVNVPDGVPFREISAAPAKNIALLFKDSGSGIRDSVAKAPVKKAPVKKAPVAKAPVTRPAEKRVDVAKTRPAQKTAQRVKHRSADPNAPVVLSARDLERELLEQQAKEARSPKTSQEPKAASAPSKRRKSGRVRLQALPALPPLPALPAPRVGAGPSDGRSAIASRGGAVDRSDLLAGVEGMPDEAAPETPVSPWDAQQAITLINDGNAPEPLRRRLIDVVSDPAIQTSRYVWGAETPGQFDCSGLALYIYEGLNVKLPRCSWQQCEVGQPVDRESLRAGDLVFFIIRGKSVSHVGIYLGDGQFLHAANPRSNLKITALDSTYYAKRFAGARRVFDVTASEDPSRLGG